MAAPDVTALNLSALTQALEHHGPRAHAKRLRFKLISVPGRVVHHARRTILRVSPNAHRLAAAHRRLRLLPSPSG